MNISGELGLDGMTLGERLLMYGLFAILAVMIVIVIHVVIFIAPIDEAERQSVNAELANDNCDELKEYLKVNLDTLSDSQITKAYVKLEITC